MSSASPFKKSSYALPPHLRVLHDAPSDETYQFQSNEAQHDQEEQVREGVKGTFSARFVVVAPAEDRINEGKPCFSVHLALLDDPSKPEGCVIIDETRAVLNRDTKELLVEAFNNTKVKQANGKDGWKTRKLPEAQVLRQGTEINASVYGSNSRFKDGQRERTFVIGDIVRGEGMACKFRVVEKKSADIPAAAPPATPDPAATPATAAGSPLPPVVAPVLPPVVAPVEEDRSIMYVSYSASKIQFLCHKDELGAEENLAWNTLMGSVLQEEEPFQPLIRDAKKDVAAAVAAKKLKQEDANKKAGKPAAAAGTPAAPATEADQKEAKLYAKYGAETVLNKQDARLAADEILTTESQSWKKRHFSVLWPVGGVPEQHAVFRALKKLPHKVVVAKRGFAGQVTEDFVFTKMLTADEKKACKVPERKSRWAFHLDVLQFDYARATGDQGEPEQSRVHLHVQCWAEALVYSGISDSNHLMHLFPFMAEGLKGVMRCVINTNDSLAATEKERDPHHEMHFSLSNFSKLRNAEQQALFVDHAATIVSSCWGPVLPDCVGDLLEWLGKQPDTPKDSVNRDMSLAQSDLFQMNKLNGLRGRKVANLLELDKNLLAPGVVEQYDFYVLVNRSKHYIWPYVKERVLATPVGVERSTLLSQQMRAVIMGQSDQASLAMDLFAGAHNAKTWFTVFALRRDYLDARGLKEYQGIDARADVVQLSEDYLLADAEAQKEDASTNTEGMDTGGAGKKFHARS